MARITKIDNGVFRLTIPATPLFIPEQARQVVADISRDFLELALLDVAGHVSEEAPRNLGTLAQSFLTNPAGETGGIEILGMDPTQVGGIRGRVFSSLPYAVVMEEGRGANKPISRAGVAAIALWVRRKLGLHGREAASATYAIVWKIRTSGIPAKHYARKGFNKAKPRVEQLFAQMDAAIAAGLTKS